MVNLNTASMRYLTPDDFRVLTAVELGSKNHEVVPTTLIASIAKLRGGSGGPVARCISNLAKNKLIAKMKNMTYDGYRLTGQGADYLALKAFANRTSVYSVGNQIGVGKEADVYVVADEQGKQMILKLHRLGRTSFRSIKNNRDYMKQRKSASWLYISRLSAVKEYAFMKILHDNGFPVPKPIDQARHCVVMEFIDAFPLRMIEVVLDPEKLYDDLMSLLVRLAEAGLIHGDFNEFNILVYESGKPMLIDFPQMVSIDHEDAKRYFDRDVECIMTYFKRKLNYASDKRPPQLKDIVRKGTLDQDVHASGAIKLSKRELKDLERAIEESRGTRDEEEFEGQESDGGSEAASDEDSEVDEEPSRGLNDL
jgi:RIO kinase 2